MRMSKEAIFDASLLRSASLLQLFLPPYIVKRPWLFNKSSQNKSMTVQIYLQKTMMRIISLHMCFLQVNELDPVCCNSKCILVVSYLKVTSVNHIYQHIESKRLNLTNGFIAKQKSNPCLYASYLSYERELLMKVLT